MFEEVNCSSLAHRVLPVELLEVATVVAGSSDSDVVDALAAISQIEARVAAQKAKLINELVRRAPVHAAPGREPVCDPVHEQVAVALNVSCRSAQIECTAARLLAGRAAVLAALGEGVITTRVARAIVDTTLNLTPAQIDVVEAEVMDYAAAHTPPEVKRRINRLLHARFPAVQEQQHEAAAGQRYVSMRPDAGGMALIEALLPCYEANLVFGYLNQAADQLKAHDRQQLKDAGLPANELASRATYRADALVAIAAHQWFTQATVGGSSPGRVIDVRERRDGGLLGDCAGTGNSESVGDGELVERGEAGGNGPVVAGEASVEQLIGAGTIAHVVLDLQTALGLADHAGELNGYGPIPGPLARELAASATWQRWIADDTGNLINIGTSRYRPGTLMREFITARDRKCRFPGCHQPAQRCDIDHAVPYDKGGATEPGNLGALCRRHHRLKGENGWDIIESHTDGSCTWLTPTGERVHKDNEPVLAKYVYPNDDKDLPAFVITPKPLDPDSQRRLNETGIPF